MKNKNTQILLIEDNPGDIRLVREVLAEAGAARFDLVAKMDLASGLAALTAQPVDAILLDLTLPDTTGFETFTKVHEKAPQVPIIVLTGADDDVQAAKALREGAQDYLVKGPGNNELLLRSIRYAIERKQSAEALRENEARYRNIFEGVEDAIFVETPSGQILDVNQRACDMYGFTREQFLTKSVADLVPSKEYSVLFSPDNPATVPGHPVETINVRSNGEQFPIELSLRKQESKGEPVLFVVVRDITERKRSQETIELLRHSIDIHYDGAYWTDSNNKFIYINDAGCKALGYEREELIGKNFSDINPKATPAAVERMWKSIRSKGSFTTETVHRRKDGNEFPVEIATTYIQFGGREYTCGFARDITARKHAERAIHLMSDTQRQIAQLNDITEISKLVGKKIHELIGSGYVIISMLDEKIQAMKVVGLYGFGGLYENLVRQFKIDPSEFAYPIHDMTAEELGSFRSGKLEKFAGGVYELLTRKVPKKICALVEKQMKFSGIHTMGFVNQDIHYGALTILEKGDIGPYKDMIETIMNQATISIKRIRAEQALRASELRYRAVVRLSSDFSYSCVHTSEDRYEVDWITDAFFHITGYSETEMQGQRCWMFVVHPQDIQAATEPMSRLQPGESDSREFRIFTKTGEIRWFVNTMECQSDPATSDGLRLFGAVQDITGRKQAEEAKQESDLLLRALFELSPDSIMLMDPHTPDDSWPIIDCNLAACRINGYERDELIGNSIDMVNAFPAKPADRAAYRKRMRDQGSLHLEAAHRRKDGTVFPVEISTRLIQVGQRELVIGIDRDITERKQVEAALQESEERFREIFENMTSGVVVYEAVDGGNDFKFNHFNGAAEKIENIARDTVIGKTVCEVFPGVKEFGLFETLQRVWKNGQPEHLPITFYTDERMSGWRENYIARLPSGEVLVVYDDVTERRQSEEALRASEEILRSFIEQSSEGVILLDEQGLIIEWNLAQAQITGVPPQQAIGIPFWDIQFQLLPPERRVGKSPEFFKQIMLEAFRTGKFPTSDKSIETKIYTPQGETKFILQASFPIHSAKGYRVGSLVRDITERKRAELELQASHKAEQDFSERLSTLLEVTTELSKAGGLDESCRRAVELGRERLGLDRLSIWFISDDHTTMQGTFGVDVAGRITDERQERFPIRPDFPVWSLVEGQVPLVHVPGESLYLDGQVIGQGDHVFAGLWDGNTVTGYISVDNLLSQRPFSDHDCEIIRLYASAVGRLISLKRADANLRTSEENYRGAIAAAGLVPYGIDYETQRFTFMGDNILQLTGYSAEEITPAILKDCVQESHVWGLDATGVTQEEAPRRFRSGEIKQWGNDLRITTRSGEERWLSDVSVPLQNKLGKVTSAIGIFQDLTGRKQAEHALQKSEARFRSIFENTAIGFYQTTPAGQILLANPAVLHMLGYESFEDLSKRNLEDREYQLEYPRAEFRQRIETDGEIKDLETGWVKADNSSLYVRENARVVRDESGKVLYYEGTVEDITGRKLAEEKLREASSYNRRLIEASIDPIVTIGPDGKITDVNESTEAVTGVARAQLIGDDFTNYFTEAAKARESYQKVLAEGLVRDYPLTIRHASGKTTDVLYNATVYKNDAGTIQGVFAAARDITERKQAEASLAHQTEMLRQRNEELARLYRASSSLLSGASSDLQELAQTIIAIIQQEFGQANCSLFLVQRDSNELQRLAAAGPYSDQVKNKTLTLDGSGLVPQAIRTGQTVNVGNVRSVPDYLPNWESAMSEMAVPLKIGNDVIGIIDTQSALPDAFDTKDESLMTIFAERAALALEHSRMYEQTEARVQQLAALRTVDMAISSSFDIHLTLDILLDQVRAQLGVDAADILEYNQVTQTFSFSCGQGFRTHALQHTHLRLGEGYAGRAAMERRLFKIPDLHAEQSGFGRSPLLIGENFLSYAGVPLIAKGQIKGVLEIFNRETFELSSEQQSFLEILAGQAGIAMDNAELYEHQQRSIADLTIAYNDTLEGWASALELRDKETEGHTRRVTNLTIRLARALGVNENDQVQIYRGALLHDIGKIGVPDAIVLKPGPLTGEEWELMRQHPLYAYNMLSPIGYLREALNVPYCHHEKWDGTGYPRGLKAEEIPLAARIFSVVDVWDALTSDRPYRTAWTHEKARLYITEQSGAQFEPRIVETFFREVLTQ